MKFREYLEETKLLGKLKPYEKILYNTYVDFLNDYFNVNLNIDISFRKPSNKLYFGYIDLVGVSNGKYKIIVEMTHMSALISKIGHEFTHLVQGYKGTLGYSKDQKYVTWKGADYISVKDLGKITNLDEYKKLPWETEAYHIQDIILDKFVKSKYYKSLKGKDANLDMILQIGL